METKGGRPIIHILPRFFSLPIRDIALSQTRKIVSPPPRSAIHANPHPWPPPLRLCASAGAQFLPPQPGKQKAKGGSPGIYIFPDFPASQSETSPCLKRAKSHRPPQEARSTQTRIFNIPLCVSAGDQFLPPQTPHHRSHRSLYGSRRQAVASVPAIPVVPPRSWRCRSFPS